MFIINIINANVDLKWYIMTKTVTIDINSKLLGLIKIVRQGIKYKLQYIAKRPIKNVR